MKIQIVTHDNQAGLSRDREILRRILIQGGHKVYLCNNKVNEYHRDRFDINIFNEIIEKRYFNQAKYNVFIPNPEWYFEKMFDPIIRSVDLILAKTRDCERIFKKKGKRTIFTSFTSEDRYIPEIVKKKEFIHTCGKSQAKGTDQVKMAWQRYGNDFAKLTIIEHPRKNPRKAYAPNLTHIIGRLPDSDLRRLQNECLFHICTSRYEGFGHYIWEAMSCGGIVFTNDIAPMNEFINDKIGFLVPVLKKSRLHLVTTGSTHHKLISSKIADSLKLSKDKLVDMGSRARNKWISNDKFFKERLLNIINDLK